MSSSQTGQEVEIRPIDQQGRSLLFCDIKIEGVDSGFRKIFGGCGTWKLHPGHYKVKVLLRNLEMKTVFLDVQPGVKQYNLVVESSEPEGEFIHEIVTTSDVVMEPVKQKQRHVRYDVSFPVSYRTNNSEWISTKSVNLSMAGICIENAGLGTADDGFYLRLHIPILSVPMECPASLVWVQSEGAHRRMGLRLFLTQNMKASLENWFSLMKKSG